MLRLTFCLFCLVAGVSGAGVGYDAMSPTLLVNLFSRVPAEAGRIVSQEDSLLTNGQGRWLRVRMSFSSDKLDDVAYVANERAAMAKLRAGGWKLCAIVEFGVKEWKSGTRRDQRLPLDLREVYERGQRLRDTYGDRLDAWEIGNEPDITFVPENAETYAAYLKAAWAALAAEPPRGEAEKGAQSEGSPGLERRTGQTAQPSSTQGRALRESVGNQDFSLAHRPAPLARAQEPRALVLMAPLSLPPGPWLELFVKNEGLAYTEGFNYHMYGYAGDFAGMYAAFERALVPAQMPQARKVESDASGLSPLVSRLLPPPKALSAFGDWLMSPALEYLLYSPEAKWTKSRSWTVRAPLPSPIVLDHIAVENIHAMKRYLSYLVSEEGNSGYSVGQAVVVLYNFSAKTVKGTLRLPSEARAKPLPAAAPGEVGGLGGSKKLHADMGSDPRLQLLASTEKRETTRSLPVFITEFGYAQLSGAASKTKEGRERQRLWYEEVTRQGRALGIEGMMAFCLKPYLETSAYEFGLAVEKPRESAPPAPAPMGKQDTRKVVSLPKPADLSPQRERIAGPFSETKLELSIEAGGRVEIPVEYRFEGRGFDPQPVEYVFEPEDVSVPTARWVSNLLPDPKGMRLSETARLDRLAERGAKNAERLKALPLMREEGERRASGPAWVTGAVDVTSTNEGWRFTVTALDEVVFYPINVELPWPDGLPFDDATLLRFLYRLVDERDPERTEQLDFYVRTANGNLYQVYPRLFATKAWQGYFEHKDNFTLTYYGRSNMPWRFKDNEPIGLVFRLRPRKVPATYEVRDLGLIRYQREK